ncbi:MAG: hypothetical protein RLZZ479_1125 [Bacteroidota bacterium]|jgi:thymidylate synthase
MNKLDRDYQNLLQEILNSGIKKDDRTGTGTLSVFGKQIRHQMSEGFPVLTTKKIPFRLVVAELLWFLKGETNIKYLVDNNCHIWDGDAYKGYERECFIHMTDPMTREEFISAIKNGNNKKPHFMPDHTGYKLGDLGPIYGKQWRQWQGWRDLQAKTGKGFSVWYDQIAQLIHSLRANPDSRRLMVNSWHVDEIESMVLPPCHYGFQVYTRELSLEERLDIRKKETKNGVIDYDNKNHKYLDSFDVPRRAISLMWNQRSVDTPLGLPFNIASYALLLTIIGKIVNMVPEELIGNLGDTHIYLNQAEGVNEQLTRESRELPNLKISESVNFNGNIDDFLNSCQISDFTLENYKPHPTIQFPLSN